MKLGTQIFAIALTTLLLFNGMRVTLNYGYYHIDTIGFIEAFCVNQEKPELKCNGKCHLKKISKAQDKDQKTPESIVDFKELLLFTMVMEPIVFQQKILLKKQNPNTYHNLYSYSNINDCFHPPKV